MSFYEGALSGWYEKGGGFSYAVDYYYQPIMYLPWPLP